ncbi:MAG: TIR domain-containing protein, partial [Planctomycetes bacterium]|nr:TIR domain-containing protein [Planctomycetota bacterium]
MKIFLSYGRDKHAADAQRIKEDLQGCGHDVWFDLERLTEGRDWERYIEEGLRWCEIVVLLMTPYSVRRRDRRDPDSRDGYCLNELAKANDQNKLIIPVLLATLEEGPPMSICRIQHLDLRDAVPIAEREPRYRERFERLRRAIEEDDLDFEGGESRLQKLLEPLDFSSETGRHLARFTGRKWLLGELDAWLDEPTASRVFWMTGAPGIGKTAFAVHLCHARREVIAYHLCSFGHEDKADARRALLSIAYQMAQYLPEYHRRISRLELEGEVLKSAPTLFDNLLVQPLLRDFPAPDGSRLVVIDGIDEAVAAGRHELADLIRDHWPKTPPWLRLVMTSRPEPALISALASLRPHVLDACRSENLSDLRSYLADALGDRDLPAKPDVVEEIVARSEGLFLYGYVVLEELQRGALSLDRLEDFPAGMAAHYERLFRRQFPDPDDYAIRFRQLLECFCAARDPLPVSLVATAVGLERAELQQRLGRLGSLLAFQTHSPRDEAEPVASPFHKTLVDWLTGVHPQTQYPLAGPYAVDVPAGRRRLAEACWKQYECGVAGLSTYARTHLAAHLAEASDWQHLSTVLDDADLAYLNRWIEGGGHQGKLCLEGLLEHGNLDPTDAAGLATQLARIHGYENDYGGARRWLQYALARTSFRRGRRARAIAIHEQGSLDYYEGDLGRARRAYRRALRCCLWGLPRYGDEAAANLVALAILAVGQGDYRGAERLA